MGLKVEQLSCIRGQSILFQDLSFELRDGEILHVSGPNGAGKTSLLKILCGLTQPHEGRVIWSDKKSITYVGHLLGVKNELTVKENLNFVSSLTGIKPNVLKVIEQLNLSAYQNTLCYKLSAGQRKRVALGRLLLSKAHAWILDEPLTFLDQQAISMVQQWFTQHIQENGLIIFSSHQSCTISGIKINQLELGLEANGRFF